MLCINVILILSAVSLVSDELQELRRMRDATKLHVAQALNIKPGVRKYPSVHPIIGHYHALWNFLYVHVYRKKYPNRLQVVRRVRCSRVWVNMLPALTYQLLMKIRYVYNCICSPHKLLHSYLQCIICVLCI